MGQIKDELERMRSNPSPSSSLRGITFADAKIWREDLAKFEEDGDESDKKHLELLAVDKAEEIERLYGYEKAKRWYNAATRTSATLLELMDQWLAASDYKESTNLGHRKSLDEVLAFLKNPDAHPEDISRKTAIQYIDTDLTQRDLHYNTIRDKLASLTAFWGWIASRGLIAKSDSPWTGHKVSKARNKGTRPEKRAFTDTELLALLKGTDRARKWPTWSYLPDLLVLGLYTGCREEELCALTRDRVALHRSHAVLTVIDAKSPAGNRPVGVTNPTALAILKARLKKAPEEADRLFGELKQGGADKKYSSSTVKAFVRYRRECGVPDGTDFHSFRRSVITVLENASVSQLRIARFVGHKVGTMAGDDYSAGSSHERAIETARLVRHGKAVEAAAAVLVASD